MPKTRPVMTETTIVKRRTERSSPTEKIRGQSYPRKFEQGAERGLGEDEAEDAACEGKKMLSVNQLADEASATRAHGGANGHFPATVSGAGQEKIGDVGARDEKHEANGPDKEKQCRANVFDHLFVQRNDVGAGAGVVDGVLLFQPFCDRDHFGVRLFPRGTLFKTANGEDAGMPIAIVGKGSCPRREWKIDSRRGGIRSC